MNFRLAGIILKIFTLYWRQLLCWKMWSCWRGSDPNRFYRQYKCAPSSSRAELGSEWGPAILGGPCSALGTTPPSSGLPPRHYHQVHPDLPLQLALAWRYTTLHQEIATVCPSQNVHYKHLELELIKWSWAVTHTQPFVFPIWAKYKPGGCSSSSESAVLTQSHLQTLQTTISR